DVGKRVGSGGRAGASSAIVLTSVSRTARVSQPPSVAATAATVTTRREDADALRVSVIVILLLEGQPRAVAPLVTRLTVVVVVVLLLVPRAWLGLARSQGSRRSAGGVCRRLPRESTVRLL